MTARDKELDFIWGNTKTYKTADSEIAVLCDLYDGFEKSGYKLEKIQKQAEFYYTHFVVSDREQLEDILGTLEKHNRFDYNEKWLDMRLNGAEYKNKSLGIHPSSRLTEEDLQANPMLLALLIGELNKYSYYHKGIVSDKKHGEIYDTWHNLKKPPTPAEADNYAQRISEALVKLSDLNIRNQYGAMRIGYFESEKNMGGKLGFSYEPPVLKVGEDPVYEIGIIPYATLRIKDMEKRTQRHKSKSIRRN